MRVPERRHLPETRGVVARDREPGGIAPQPADLRRGELDPAVEVPRALLAQRRARAASRAAAGERLIASRHGTRSFAQVVEDEEEREVAVGHRLEEPVLLEEVVVRRVVDPRQVRRGARGRPSRRSGLGGSCVVRSRRGRHRHGARHEELAQRLAREPDQQLDLVGGARLHLAEPVARESARLDVAAPRASGARRAARRTSRRPAWPPGSRSRRPTDAGPPSSQAQNSVFGSRGIATSTSRA